MPYAKWIREGTVINLGLLFDNCPRMGGQWKPKGPGVSRNIKCIGQRFRSTIDIYNQFNKMIGESKVCLLATVDSGRSWSMGGAWRDVGVQLKSHPLLHMSTL
jgi:hypothetical protein